VNAVAPGLTLPTVDYDAALMARIADAMPLGLLPSPDDIADAVAYLANAKSVTGQTLFVDGGASLKSFERDFVYL
jgi:NAD(P)-dependent dehydrogenase (short-subunit alcohol dehydrogenase family)